MPLVNFRMLFLNVYILVLGFSITCSALGKDQLRIEVENKSSLLNEVRVVDIARDEKLRAALAQPTQKISLQTNVAGFPSVQTSINTYSGQYFTSGLRFPSVEVESDIDFRWAVAASAGWVSEERVVPSPIYAQALVRAHVVPLQVDLRYSLLPRDGRFIPSATAGLLDMVWIQRSDLQMAQTSDNFIFFKPGLRADLRIWRGLYATAYAAYLYPLDTKYSAMKEAVTGLGIAMSLD